ncbi:MAG: hypothetical protein IPF78_11370 [Flavobacteriales bacterium]|nr:hypothetical protein [Flavobacteriales bacterium]
MITPILLSLLPCPSAMAQQDSLATDSAAARPARHSLTLSAGANGMKVKVENADTNYAQKGDTIRITSKREAIRIITTPRTGFRTPPRPLKKLAT